MFDFSQNSFSHPTIGLPTKCVFRETEPMGCMNVHTCVEVWAPGKVRTPEGSLHRLPQQQAKGSSVHVLYSTPACYLWELNKANLTWYLGKLGSLGGLACPVGHDPALNAPAAVGQ